jgi:hypothetical protein
MNINIISQRLRAAQTTLLDNNVKQDHRLEPLSTVCYSNWKDLQGFLTTLTVKTPSFGGLQYSTNLL